jgi:general secretion pathway protein E
LRLLRPPTSPPHGMILVTGPTGSGKTTTLYGALRTLDAAADKIISIEDPIEYQIAGVTQIQVKPEIELSFARILRSVVRHDPNVIMVGETRDAETAEIAVHAALTGHLMLTTLHTNSAAGAIARLLDMGIEDFLLASAVIGILAQRLVRLVCPDCRAPVPLEMEGEACSAGLSAPLPDTQFVGRGCPACAHTGYRGRSGIYELLLVNEEIRQLILKRTDAVALRQAAIAAGMQTLAGDGWHKVAQGLTNYQEVLRVTQE